LHQIEYFYSAHSAYAYLGAKKLQDISRAHDCALIHRPIVLSPVVEAAGGRPFDVRTPAHVDYFFGRELERWAAWRKVSMIVHRPVHHDADYSLASGAILALGEHGAKVDAMSFAILQAHWRDDADLSDETTLATLIAGQGHDPIVVLKWAASEPIQARLQDNTQEAIERSVFGSPTYFLDGDMFYGQDHLELLEGAAKGD